MKLARKLFLILLIAVLAVGVAYFYKINDNVVDLDLVFYKFEEITVGSMSVMIFLMGIIFTVILTFIEIVIVSGREFKLKRENKKLKKQIAKLKKKYEVSEEDSETQHEMLPEPIEDENETEED